MSSQSRALLLVNPHSRSGQGKFSEISTLLQAAGLAVVTPSEKLKPSEAILKYRDQIDLVVIGGGDGSLNAGIGGLLETQLPLGVVPLGTANDFARTLGIPDDPAAACALIADGHTRRVDVGCVNGRHFFNAASVGLSVAIAQKLTKKAKGRWGIFAYMAAATSVLRHVRPFRVEIHCDGQVHRSKSVQVTIGNGRHFGGGLTVTEHSEIDDGVLSVYSLEMRHWWHIVKLFPALRAGTVSGWENVSCWTGREVELITRRPRSVNTDGDVTTKTPAKFSILPQALSVLVPRSE